MLPTCKFAQPDEQRRPESTQPNKNHLTSTLSAAPPSPSSSTTTAPSCNNSSILLTRTLITLISVCLCLLRTNLTCLCLLFVFSLILILSASTPNTRTRHSNNLSSTYGVPLSVKSREPSTDARLNRSTFPGCTFGIRKGRRR